jgi:acyl-CoA dehydrogenase
MIFAMHQIQVACLLAHGMDHSWFRDLARRVANEGLLLASITSEVGIGGDMRSSRCAVERVGERFTLVKQAPTVSYGDHADAFLVTARADPAASTPDQRLVAVLRADCRMEATDGWDAVGMRGTCSGGFLFDGAGGVEQILPTPFADIAAETMTPVSHLLWSAAWTGIAIEATAKARRFLRARARRQPDATLPGGARLARAVGAIESMQRRLRALLAAYDASHALGSDRAAVTADEAGWPTGMARATTLNLLKCDVSEMCHDAVMQAMMICGMAGYRNDTDFSIGRHLRDVLSAQLMISNDRVAAITGTLLVAQRSDYGEL